MKSKKLLFIINETNNTELDNLNFNKNDFFIINLSNNKHPQSNYNYFQKKIYYDLYNNSFLKYNSTKKFIKKINTNKYFKYLKFSEMNLSDFFWKNYVYYVISTIKNNKCYFMREGKVKKLNNNFFFFVKPLISKQLILKLSIIKILNFLNDFLITIFSILFIKKKIVPKKTDIIIHPNSNYKIVNNSLSFRYIKNQKLFSTNKKFYVLSLSRDNSDKVINIFQFIKNYYSLKNIENLIILESYSSIIKLFKCYFQKLNKDLIYSNLNLKIFGYDLGKNLFFKSFITEFKYKNTHISSNLIIYPFFEFIFGRIVSEVFNSKKFQTISFQHGTLGLFHKWRFYNSINLISNSDTELLPYKIIFEGSNTFNWYKLINIKKKILRPNRSLLKISKYKENSSTLMLMLDMHDWENLLDNSINFLEYQQYKLIIRPHPSRVHEVRNYLGKNFNANIVIDLEMNLTRSIKLYKPVLFLIGQSGVAAELILNKLNVALILNSNLQNYSPVLFFQNIKKFYFNKNINRDLNKFIKITNFKSYSNKLHAEVKKIININ